jgi:selenium-binding protein 1
MIPDQTFYPSPSMATQAPPETIAYVAMLNPHGGPDALTVLDVDHSSTTYGQPLHQVDMPNVGDELHHFGWNACSSPG